MVFDKDDIENILKSTPVNQELVDFFALQELVIVVDIFSEVLIKVEKNNQQNQDFDKWQNQVAQEVTKELKSSEMFFGIKDLADKLDIAGFLKAFYQLYYKQ